MSFRFKQFSITKQTEGLKVNTDGCLLGALANVNNPSHCLDIGTGTGVIALMLAQKFPSAKTTAIEINPTVFEQAVYNIQHSPFASNIECICSDVANYSPAASFDLIACNPPYFSNHLKGNDLTKNQALHNDELGQDTLANAITRLLSQNGLCWIIYPPREMELFESVLPAHDLHIAEKIRVENKPGHYYRSIVTISKLPQTTKEQTLIITTANGERTEAFSAIMQDFYL
ncbi:MAG: methyltransferase [Bacteroidota bacterium]